MSDAPDLRPLLKSWPYDPEKDARIIRGDDDRELLQVRTPMGIEQYEMDGRPDGERPHGRDSALDHFLSKLERAREEGRESEFSLSARDCGELFNEGTLYYFRYVRLFQLKDWSRTVRDTTRNLRVFDFVQQYARREEDRGFLEKWRPYVIRVNATAAAMMALDTNHYDRAVKLVDDAINRIEGLPEQDEETFRFERERSLTALRELLSEIRKNRPMSELEKLEAQLRGAIARQEFERAAELRDRIRAMKKQET